MNDKTVLIIDDNIDFVNAYRAVLEAEGFDVTYALTGAAGMKKLIEEMPDIIILDVMMEEPDAGYEFMKRLKEAEITTPVILCSTIADAGLQNFDTNALGAKAILQKPVDLEELVATVNKYV